VRATLHVILTEMYSDLYREEQCRKRVKELKKQLVEVRRSKERELTVSQ